MTLGKSFELGYNRILQDVSPHSRLFILRYVSSRKRKEVFYASPKTTISVDSGRRILLSVQLLAFMKLSAQCPHEEDGKTGKTSGCPQTDHGQRVESR